MAGDPPNIIIGTSLGYSFSNFLVNTGLIAWVGMAVALVFFYFVFRKALKTSHVRNIDPNQYPEAKNAIVNHRLFLTFIAIFLLVIVLLITHAQTGISVAFIGVIAAGLTLTFGYKDASIS